VLGGFEVEAVGFGGLRQHDVTGLADRVGALDVQRDLEAPAGGFFGRFGFGFAAGARGFEFADRLRKRQVAGFAELVDLFEAAVRGRARGQREDFVEGAKVGFGGRVVVGVHDRDRLGGGGTGRKRVDAVEVLGAQAEVAGGRGGCLGLADGGQAERVQVGAGGGGAREE
jgi:hypothetical protein